MIVVWKLSLMAALYMGKYFLENLNLTISLLLYASVTSCQSSSGAAKLIITVLSTFSFSKFYFWWQIKPLKRGMKFIGPLDRIYVSLCVTATLELIPSHWDDDKINSPSLSGGVKLLLSVTSSGLWVIFLQQWDTLFLKSLFCRTFWKWNLLSNARTCDCCVTCVNLHHVGSVEDDVIPSSPNKLPADSVTSAISLVLTQSKHLFIAQTLLLLF